MKSRCLLAGLLALAVSCGGGGSKENAFVAVASVEVKPSQASLTEGETLQLSATVSPSNATETKVNWTSSNSSAASVSDAGLVTAKSAGSASVTAACGSKFASCSISVTAKQAPAPETSFASGADVSWVTEMERDGVKFKDASGNEKDLFVILAGLGMNAVRLRVFVDGPEQWSEKEDVVAKAVRAKNAGMDVMIDFHYSDFFADPSRQTTPAAWKGLALDKLAEKVSSHTSDVLTALKDAGVSPKWVQIGNETRNGMLWDAGRFWNSDGDIKDGRKNFVALYNAGYNAAKTVFPEAKVMPHVDNAYSDNAWWFTQTLAEGLKMDMIALSHYPMYDSDADWKQRNTQALAQVKALYAAFKVPVMISEVGISLTRWNGSATVSWEADAKTCLSEFITGLKATDGAAGVFYWEPEVYGGWKPAVYKDVSAYVPGEKGEWEGYTTGAFTSDGKPSSALDAFKN